MPRPERPLDPLAGPVPAFAAELRKLRDQAGNPKYLQMARLTGKSRTALAEAAGGDHLPTWETVEAYVTACGADPLSWRLRWEEVEEQVRARRAQESRLPAPRPAAAPAPVEPAVERAAAALSPEPAVERAAELATASAGPSELATASAGPSELATAGAGPSELATAGAGPSELVVGPEGDALERPFPAAALIWTDARQRRPALDRRLVALAAVLVVFAVLSASAAGMALLASKDGGGIGSAGQAPVEAAVHANPQSIEIHSADLASVQLASRPAGGCAERGCALPDKVWPGQFWVASCYTAGEMMTDANPDRIDDARMPNGRDYRSNGWYGLPLYGERLGYLSEVNVLPKYRGGLNLPDCPKMQPLQPR